MLTASKELGIIKRKRKKSFKAFDPAIDKEETKGRSKLNDDSKNQRITDWLIEKKPKRKEKKTNNETERMQRNEIEERMNIDNEPQNTKNPFIKKIVF